MEWIHDEYSVVEKHAQTMLQLLEFGMRGICWETWRTGADREYSSFTDCGRNRRGEYSSFTDCGRDRRGEQIFDCVEQYPEPLL